MAGIGSGEEISRSIFFGDFGRSGGPVGLIPAALCSSGSDPSTPGGGGLGRWPEKKRRWLEASDLTGASWEKKRSLRDLKANSEAPRVSFWATEYCFGQFAL